MYIYGRAGILLYTSKKTMLFDVKRKRFLILSEIKWSEEIIGLKSVLQTFWGQLCCDGRE
jgi:hypothetical protein